ncbi:hypothetical protein QTP88_006141 [Uroleucon formosanum]
MIFSQLRVKCKCQSKLDYLLFIKNTENAISSNPSNFWKFTKDLKSNPPIPSTVHLHDESASSPVDSANLFSKYFLSVFKPPLPSPSSTHLDHLYLYNLPSKCLFSLKDILSALASLKKNNSNDPDGISARLLYNCRCAIATLVFILYRRSLDEGIFPDVWKTCSIIPFIKAVFSNINDNLIFQLLDVLGINKQCVIESSPLEEQHSGDVNDLSSCNNNNETQEPNDCDVLGTNKQCEVESLLLEEQHSGDVNDLSGCNNNNETQQLNEYESSDLNLFTRPSTANFAKYWLFHPNQPKISVPFAYKKTYFRIGGGNCKWVSYRSIDKSLFCSICLCYGDGSGQFSKGFID